MKIAINSKTNGHFRTEQLGGREHIVTEMVPIVGDSVMNGGLYPDDEVSASFTQLNMLPAPNGHTKIDGIPVSAFHPMATNAQNIGGFIRNPRKDGKVVTNELWVDVEVANAKPGGVELIRRIKEEESVGVSTGLGLRKDIENGVGPDGKDYDWIGRDFHFDHVAVLLNEKSAGAHVGTELKFNDDTGDDTLSIVALNELGFEDIRGQLLDKLEFAFGTQDWVWIMDIFPETKQFIYERDPREGGESTLWKQGYAIDSREQISLLDDAREVEKVVEFVEKGGSPVTNAKGGPSMADENTAGKELAKEQEAAKTLENAAPELTAETAIAFLAGKGLTVVTNEQATFLTAENMGRVADLIKQDDERLGTMRELVVANSEFTEEDAKTMSEATLTKVSNSLHLTVDNGARPGGGGERTPAANADDHEETYAPDYSDEGGGE